MRIFLYLPILCLSSLFLQGCATRGTLTALPSRPIDTWMLGVWKYTDHKGNSYRAGIFPLDSTHFSMEIQPQSGPYKNLGPRYFRAFISRVDRMYFLNLLPANPPPQNGLVGSPQLTGLTQPFASTSASLLAHYQLESPVEMVVTPLHLSVAGRSFPWKLRQNVRALAKAGILLPPQNSLCWQKVSEVYWQKNASLASQPFQPLRIPKPNPKIPAQDAALNVGPSKGFSVTR